MSNTTLLVGTKDGTVFTGTAEQVVGYLWKAAFLRKTSPHRYMRAVARRVRLGHGRKVRTDTPTHFLHDLDSVAVIHILSRRESA